MKMAGIRTDILVNFFIVGNSKRNALNITNSKIYSLVKEKAGYDAFKYLYDLQNKCHSPARGT